LPVLGRRQLRQRLELSRRRRIRRNDLGPLRLRTPPADTTEMTVRGANDIAELRYVIIGGGMAAYYATRGYREVDAGGSFTIFSCDVDEPYTRPALSKRLWTDEGFDESDNYFDTAEATGARISLRTEATEVDLEAKSVQTTLGSLSYDKLLF